MKKIIELFSKMSWEGFFPNFLGVILGILITFGGNALWQDHEDKKKTKEMLTLLGHELQKNKEWIENLKINMSEDKRVYGKVLEAKSTLSSMPEDTLKYYYDVVAKRFYQSALTTTAWQIFQNSEIIQKMPNQDLLIRLSNCYFWLGRIQDNYMINYRQDKEKAKVFEVEPVKYFETAMQNKETLFFYSTVSEIGTEDLVFFDQVNSLMDSIIELLEKEI